MGNPDDLLFVIDIPDGSFSDAHAFMGIHIMVKILGDCLW